MVNTSAGRGTAKIFKFPERPTSRPNVARASLAGGDIKSLQIAKGAFDGAWYHDAEIQDALRASKR